MGWTKAGTPAESKNWFLGFRGIIIFFFLLLSLFIVEKHGTGVRKIEIKKNSSFLTAAPDWRTRSYICHAMDPEDILPDLQHPPPAPALPSQGQYLPWLVYLMESQRMAISCRQADPKWNTPVSFLVVQWFRIGLAKQGMWVWPLVRELISHMLWGN